MYATIAKSIFNHYDLEFILEITAHSDIISCDRYLNMHYTWLLKIRIKSRMTNHML